MKACSSVVENHHLRSKTTNVKRRRRIGVPRTIHCKPLCLMVLRLRPKNSRLWHRPCNTRGWTAQILGP